MKIFQEILQKKYKQTVGVVMANDGDIIAVVTQAIKRQLANFILYGPQWQIKSILKKYHFNKVEIVDCSEPEKCLLKISEDIKKQRVDVIMKGLIDIEQIKTMFLDEKNSLLKSTQLISHVTILKFEHYHKLLFLTDCVINVNPNFSQKIMMINNALLLMNSLNFKIPKIALISATTENEQGFQWANEAREIVNLPDQIWSFTCKIVGPITFELALQKPSTSLTILNNDFVGDADLLVLDNRECANILYKSLLYFTDALSMGIVLGGKIPIILASFIDDIQNTLLSIALALWFINN